MSRVEDDRDAARVAARLAEAKRAEETKKSERTSADSTFKKLVGNQQQQTQQTQKGAEQKSVIAHLLESAEAHAAAEHAPLEQKGAQKQQESAFRSKLGQGSIQEKVAQGSRNDGQASQKLKLSDDQGQTQAAQGRSTDQTGQSRNTETRRSEGKNADAKLEAKKSEGAESAGVGGAGGNGKAEKGELKADADKGSGGQSGSGGKEGKDGAAAPGFRFNPALMAPVPVSKQKEVSGSERLRKVANEIAQKIVERVRVGTNAAGKVEMQIDLRSDVLSGMTVKVSSHNGKIKAVFSGGDRETSKLLEEQGEALKSALGTRGLTLEEFKVEART
jgi:hypothetical protein